MRFNNAFRFAAIATFLLPAVIAAPAGKQVGRSQSVPTPADSEEDSGYDDNPGPPPKKSQSLQTVKSEITKAVKEVTADVSTIEKYLDVIDDYSSYLTKRLNFASTNWPRAVSAMAKTSKGSFKQNGKNISPKSVRVEINNKIKDWKAQAKKVTDGAKGIRTGLKKAEENTKAKGIELKLDPWIIKRNKPLEGLQAIDIALEEYHNELIKEDHMAVQAYAPSKNSKKNRPHADDADSAGSADGTA